MIQNKITFLLTMLFLTTSVSAANHYVSDELFAYTHKGPGTQYKILGLVNAGDKIQVISTDKKTGYTQIKDKKGRSVWLESKYVSNKPGLKKQLEKLTISEENSKEKIINLENKLNFNLDKVQELEKTNLALSSQLEEVQEINATLSDKMNNEKNEILLQWFTYGGMVAGGGLLLGLILPSLIPSRKKKSSW